MDGEVTTFGEDTPESIITEANSSQEISKPEANSDQEAQCGKDFVRNEIKAFLDESEIQTKNSPETLAERHLSMGERLAEESWVEGVDISQIKFDEKYVKDLDRIEGKAWYDDKKDQETLKGFRQLALRQLRPEPKTDEEKEQWKYARQHAAASIGVSPAQLERVYLPSSKREETDLLALSRYNTLSDRGIPVKSLPPIEISINEVPDENKGEMMKSILTMYQRLSQKFGVEPRLDQMHKIQIGGRLLARLGKLSTIEFLDKYTPSILRAGAMYGGFPYASLIGVETKGVIAKEFSRRNISHELTHALTVPGLTGLLKGQLGEGIAEAGANYIRWPDFQVLQKEQSNAPLILRAQKALAMRREFLNPDGSYTRKSRSGGYGEPSGLFYRYLLETKGAGALKDAVSSLPTSPNSWKNSINAIERKIGHIPDLIGEAAKFYYGEDAWGYLTKVNEITAFLGSGEKDTLAKVVSGDFFSDYPELAEYSIPRDAIVINLHFRRPSEKIHGFRALAFQDKEDNWRYLIREGKSWGEANGIVDLKARLDKVYE